jgi:hypothetical protein
MTDSLIPITDEQAKLGQEIMKLGQETLKNTSRTWVIPREGRWEHP